MRLGSIDEYLEVQFEEKIPPGKHSVGNVRISVVIDIEGFAGRQ